MRIAVFFATREGQTSKIANRIADDLRAKGVTVDVVNVRKLLAPPNWSTYATAFVAASIHGYSKSVSTRSWIPVTAQVLRSGIKRTEDGPVPDVAYRYWAIMEEHPEYFPGAHEWRINDVRRGVHAAWKAAH